jgi:hypothetical protein
MYHYFAMNRDEFLTRYHKRSNVEATLSMIKRVFGDSVRSKTETACINEVLLKILAHNIRCLIHEMHALGSPRRFRSSVAPIVRRLPQKSPSPEGSEAKPWRRALHRSLHAGAIPYADAGAGPSQSRLARRPEYWPLRRRCPAIAIGPSLCPIGS